ncbi:uncharacterized protein LOC116852751 isoform X2 [Odontomachus brunneus]|uniref:uncharacterized protein LOC116852751 isoform X2 n=1 Tax=Odontomachus brunneus TaxID=486640 RepID=UPI0013F244B2|nr:uncharacterized protein LOC116852751 isoform X2 [Odontomachus brunneus]
MRIKRSCWVLLTVALLSPINGEKNADEVDDGGKTQAKISTSLKLVDEDGQNRTDKAMRPPEKREQIGERISTTRSVSPPQKLSMAALIAKRTSNNDTTSSTFEEVRSLLGGSRANASRELMLPISMDITKIISEDSVEETDEEEEEEDTPEALPEAQELRLVKRPHDRRRPLPVKPLRPIRPSPPNRRNVYTGPSRINPVIRPSKRPNEQRRPTESECTFFTKTVCLEANDYPHEAITRSLRTNKEMVAALLTDYKMQDYGSAEEKLPIAQPLENKFETRYENRYENNEIRRRSDNPFDNVEEGFTCPSTVKYARPQLARAASGVWKYIINTGEHTQTLRLEKCSNPQSSCSFISENYRSSCVQIYNYHRLLTWDQKLGLHMDIFKVPTCCSCHVHGYSEIFPPHQKDPPIKPKETFPGADFAINDHKDDFQDLGKPALINKYNPITNFDSSLMSSNKKQVLDTSPSRPSFTLPGRTRTKKPSTVPRPYDKLPQQHAPNTRAPGYKGPLTKVNRPNRLSRPSFRRESTSHVEDYTEIPGNSSIKNRYSQPYDQEVDASSRLQNGGFDEEYQEPHKRINYNYHPIIDFFKPEASMLQAAEPQHVTQPATVQNDNNAWKPMIT